MTETSDRELARIVRGTVEAPHDERVEAREELQARGYDEDLLLDLAGPMELADIHEGFSK